MKLLDALGLALALSQKRRKPIPAVCPVPPPSPASDDRPYTVRLAEWIAQTQDRKKP